MSIKSLFAASAIALAIAGVPAANAGVVESQNVTFTITVTDAAAGIFTLGIDDLLSGPVAPGDNWADVTSIGALAFKFDEATFDVAGTTIAPGSATGSGNELNANGCTGGMSGGICFTFAPLFAASDDMLFTIDLNGSIALTNDFIHLKVNFHNAAGEQIGDILSVDVPTASTSSSFIGGTGSSGIPEPGSSSLALLGLGLLGASFWARKKKA